MCEKGVVVGGWRWVRPADGGPVLTGGGRPPPPVPRHATIPLFTDTDSCIFASLPFHSIVKVSPSCLLSDGRHDGESDCSHSIIMLRPAGHAYGNKATTRSA